MKKKKKENLFSSNMHMIVTAKSSYVLVSYCWLFVPNALYPLELEGGCVGIRGREVISHPNQPSHGSHKS